MGILIGIGLNRNRGPSLSGWTPDAPLGGEFPSYKYVDGTAFKD